VFIPTARDEPATVPSFYTGPIAIEKFRRFENAEGELFFKDATFGPEGSFWELVGEITY
jgi:hypothetical protein